MTGMTPDDKRGKHISHSLPTAVHDLVRNHISSFPLKECHYLSGPRQYYLSAGLSIKMMWKLYVEKHLQNKVSYYFYWTFFRDNFNYKFGRPQVDTCCMCEELNVKIKSPRLNDAVKRRAVTELLVHNCKSRKFYAALQHEKSEEGKKEGHVISLSFDFMQNVFLPKIPVQDVFYLRQLTVNVFCINNIKTDTSTLYLYYEGEGMKCVHF